MTARATSRAVGTRACSHGLNRLHRTSGTPAVTPVGSPDCKSLQKVLNHFKVGSMIVGHTVQENGINSKCDNKIWKVDTGMSDAFGPMGKIQVLEILNNGKKTNEIKKPFKVITIRTK